MGLDMFLNRSERGHRKADGSVSKDFSDYDSDEFGVSNSITTTTNVGYWRKANQIHRWFVENLGGGTDDCTEIPVSLDDIKGLRDICLGLIGKLDGMKLTVPDKQIKTWRKLYKGNLRKFKSSITISQDNLDLLRSLTDLWELQPEGRDICANTLPTQDGFFFGSTNYGGSYIADIANTILMLNRVISRDEGEKDYNVSFTYRASW